MRRRLHGIDPWRFAAADDPEWHPDDTCLWCLEQGWATLDSASFENGDQLGSNVEQDQVVTGTGQWSAAATPFSAASNGSNLSVCCVTIRCMEVTARAVEAIPCGNLHVSRDEFVALWRLVEHLGETYPADWYVAGVAMTCQWLACAAVPSILGGWELAWAPVTERSGLAHEEAIEAELFAAELPQLRNPGGIPGRPGWLEGIVATLQWAWAGSSAPPLDMPSTNAG